MKSKLKGLAHLTRFLVDLPGQLENNVARGALRTGVTVIADEAKRLTHSADVAEKTKVTTSVRPGLVTAKLTNSSWLAPWGEYGTAPHLIGVKSKGEASNAKVDPNLRASVRRANRKARQGDQSLVIGGHFIGPTVIHPGVRNPVKPFRTAIDEKQGAAWDAAQAYIKERIVKGDLGATAGDDVA